MTESLILYLIHRTDLVGCGKGRVKNATSVTRLECLRAVKSTTFANASFAILANASTDTPAGNASK